MTKKARIRVLLFLFVLALALILAVAFGITYIFGLRATWEFSIAHNFNTLPQSLVHTTEGGAFIADHNSTSFVNVNGQAAFQHIHNIYNPVLIGRGAYAAVIESRGQVAHVYNAGGRVYTVNTPSPIRAFALSYTGYLGIIMHSNNGYDIQIHSAVGMPFYGRHVDQFISPVALDISKDGRYIAISYVDINDARMNSLIKFIFFDSAAFNIQALQEDGQVDGIFASHADNPNQIMGYLRFVTSNRLMAISDSRIALIDPHNNAQILWEIELNNRISRIVKEDGWFAVAYGEQLINRSGYSHDTVVVYNMQGNVMMRHSSVAVEAISAFGDLLMISGGGRSYIYNVQNGEELAALSSVGDMRLINNRATLELLSIEARILNRD